MFWENNNYRQIGNAYLQYEITVGKHAANPSDRILIDGDNIRLVKIPFSYCFREAIMATTGASDIEHNQYVGQILTILRPSTRKDGYLLSHFDKIDESESQSGNASLKNLLINNHDIADNEEKILGQLSLEHILGFRKTH